MDRESVHFNPGKTKTFAIAAATIVFAFTRSGQAQTPSEFDFFETKIRPVLVDQCYKCHSATSEKVKGGLLLDTREGIRTTGDSGHAVVPGDPKASLLLKAIRYTDPDLQMPPKKEGGKLSDAVIADLEQWISMGASDPRDGKTNFANKGPGPEKGRDHWAFLPPKKSTPPPPNDTKWSKNAIDQFVLAKLDEHRLKPVGVADPRALIRRLSFDLVGLPPTPQEVDSFLSDYRSALPNPHSAIESLVNRLLASPQFGERWGRHWLDVARYAESSGKENNVAYPHAWRYRDYVIKAFNEDKPCDRFLKE